MPVGGSVNSVNISKSTALGRVGKKGGGGWTVEAIRAALTTQQPVHCSPNRLNFFQSLQMEQRT